MEIKKQHYVPMKTFEDVRCNQDKLIQILNHSVTELKIDVRWLKKVGTIQTTILGGIFVAVVGALVKTLL